MQQPASKGTIGRATFKFHEELMAALRRHDPDKAERALRADIASATAVVTKLSGKSHAPPK